MKIYIIIVFIVVSNLFGHCQIPCGIYDDKRIILELEEDIVTISKAIDNIILLSNKSQKSAQDNNQLTRWINTKDEHAEGIQNSFMTYFLAQRIKPQKSSNDEYQRYVQMTLLSQEIIYYAMKTKQTVDKKNIEMVQRLIADFSALYLN